MSRLSLRAAMAIGIAIGASACDGGVGPPEPPTVSLLPETRTIQVGESLQLSASVDDPSDRVSSADVSWSSLEQEVATVSAGGLALGQRPGLARIVAEVAGVADTSRLTVAQTPGSLSIDTVPFLFLGEDVQMRARVIDTEGATMSPSVEWSVSDQTIARITAAGVLTALREGTVTVMATAAPASDELRVPIHKPAPPPGCDEATAITLGVGQTRAFAGGEPMSLCLSGGAEYLVVAANAGDSVRVAGVAAEGVRAPDTPANLIPSPTLRTQRTRVAEPQARFGADFERRLRQRERLELSPRAAHPRVSARTLQATPTARAVGDLMPLNTASGCLDTDTRVGRVEYVGERAIVVADTANPVRLAADQYERFGMLYDTLLYPVVSEHFGEPAGMNGETRVVMFYTQAVNELTPASSNGVVGGYFWSGDLFPHESCPGSNEREMFYLLTADPEGIINGNARSVEYVERVTAGTIAHELQHLINASRRLYVNDADDWEASWLNEGLSHIAEELVFYNRSGLSPGMNLGPEELGGTQTRLDITNRYAVSNLLRLDRYLRAVEDQGPFQGDADLATRGASWQFLRYALDRNGGDPRVLLAALVDARTSGLTNFEGVFGVDARDWFVDGAVSVFVDDWVSPLDVRYRQPSWHFRDLFDWINNDGFVVSHRTLRDGGDTDILLRGWGTTYLRAAVAAGRVGKVQVGSADEPPSASLRLVLMRTH